MLLLMFTLLVVFSRQTQAEQRLNVVFFLVDDLGQRDVACYGSQFYETPFIDALAKEGILDMSCMLAKSG